MAVNAICCPKCGAGLEGGILGSMVRCSHCGSSLRITRSASGSLQAVLAEIELNTEYVAKETALARLESTVASLVAEKKRLEAQRVAETDYRVNEAVPPREKGWTDVCIVGGLIGVLLGASAIHETGIIALVSAVVLVAGLCVNADRETERRTLIQRAMPGIQAKVQARYGPTLAALDAEIADTRATIDRLREEVVQMAREV